MKRVLTAVLSGSLMLGGVAPALGAVTAPTVAVLPFENHFTNPEYQIPQVAAVAEKSAEMAVTRVFPGVQLVERSRIEVALKEVALGQSGWSRESARIGELLKADYLLLGSVDSGHYDGTQRGEVYPEVTCTADVSVKLLDSATGRIVGMADGNGATVAANYQGSLAGLFVRATRAASAKAIVGLAEMAGVARLPGFAPVRQQAVAESPQEPSVSDGPAAMWMWNLIGGAVLIGGAAALIALNPKWLVDLTKEKSDAKDIGDSKQASNPPSVPVSGSALMPPFVFRWGF